MTATRPVAELVNYRGVACISYLCGGCGGSHVLALNTPDQLASYSGPKWDWNGDTEKPTISPSIRGYYPHPKTGAQVTTCHHFVKNGEQRFCGDDPNKPSQVVALAPID